MKISKTLYDSAKKHLASGFPEALPMEQAYVHIGMYLGWVIESGLYSEYFKEEASTQIFRFKRKEISCTILSEIWNGYLFSEFLNDSGNHFTVFYYATGLYHRDYEEVLGRALPSMYHVDDTWSNYDALKARIKARYEAWMGSSCLLWKARSGGRSYGKS